MPKFDVDIGDVTVTVEAENAEAAARKAYAVKASRGGKTTYGPMDMSSKRDPGMVTPTEATGRFDEFKRSPIPTALSTAGSIVGQRLGGRPGGALGAGAGAVAGEVINPYVWGGPEPTMRDLIETGVFAGGADLVGGEVAGRLRQAYRGAFATPRPGAQATVGAMRDLGVDPKVTDVTASRVPAMLESAVRQMPSGQAITETVERQGQQLGRAADDFLKKIGGAEGASAEVTGQRAKDAIQAEVKRTKAIEDHIWTGMRDMTNDIPVSVRGVRTAAQDLLEQEQSRQQPRAKVVDLLQKITKIGGQGQQAPWQHLDALRREVAENLSTGELTSGQPTAHSRRLYGEIMGALEQAAEASDIPGVRERFQQVRAFSQRRLELFRDSDAADILTTPAEKIVGLLSPQSGPTYVRNARAAIMGSPETGAAMADPKAQETWDLVRRHILEGVMERGTDKGPRGLSNPILSGGKLEKEIAKLGDDTLKELLTPSERKALDNILTVAKAIRASERTGAAAFTSTTPQGFNIQNAISGGMPGALAGSLLSGPAGAVVGGATSALGYFFTPRIIARALTNPKTAEAIAAGGQTIRGASVEELTRLAARWIGIMSEERLAQDRYATGVNVRVGAPQ